MDQLTKVSHEYRLALWTDRIKECRASGLTVAKWCEQKNIGIKNYYYWMRKIKREVFENFPEKPKQNPLALATPGHPVFSKLEFNSNKSLNAEIAITIHLNDISIDIRSGATEIIIRNTLLALQSINQGVHDAR